MSVKTYYSDAGIQTKDKSPVKFYLNGGRDEANVIIKNSIFNSLKLFGPTASNSTDNITFPLPAGQAGFTGVSNPNIACQSYYGSDGGLGVTCFTNGASPATLRAQSNYTRVAGHSRFSSDNRQWRAKNIILTKNACLRIPYVDFAITTSTAASIDLTSQTILGSSGRPYARNAVAFRVRRTVSRASGQDTITIPNGIIPNIIGSIIIICNLSSQNLQILPSGGNTIDDPKSTQTGTLPNITIPAMSEIILMYRSSTSLAVLHSLP